MSRKALISLGIFVVLLAIVGVVELTPEKGEVIGYTIPRMKDVADRIEIVREKETVVLEKKGQGWMMTNPVEFRASDTAVKSLLEAFENEVGMDLKIPVTEEELAKYELDKDHAISLKLKGGGKELASFDIGKAVGSRTFIRPSGESVVYRAMASLRWKVDKGASDWRDKRIFAIERKDVTRVEMGSGSEARIVLERKDEGGASGSGGDEKEASKPVPAEKWAITGPRALPVDDTAVSALIGSIVNMQAADFADGIKLEEAGFGPDSFRVTVHTRSGDAKTLVVGGLVGENRLEGKYKEDYFVTVEGSDTVYIVREYAVRNVHKPLSELRNRDVFRLRREDIVGLRSENADGKVVEFRKEGDDWKAASPADLKDFDLSLLNSLLSSLASLKAAEVLEGVEAKTAGLAGKPAGGQLTVTMKDGTSHILALGKVKNEETKDRYARVVGQDDVTYVLRDYVVRQITRDAEGYRKN